MPVCSTPLWLAANVSASAWMPSSLLSSKQQRRTSQHTISNFESLPMLTTECYRSEVIAYFTVTAIGGTILFVMCWMKTLPTSYALKEDNVRLQPALEAKLIKAVIINISSRTGYYPPSSHYQWRDSWYQG
jgi:hypothetical protein